MKKLPIIVGKNLSRLQKGLLLLSMLIFSVQVFAAQQQVEVSGTVTDVETGEPLPGVNIVVEGTTLGTITDVEGNYTFRPPSDATLVFTFIGYQPQAIEVNGRRMINVEMVPVAEELDEVVVVAYGRQSRLSTTGAIVGVGSAELETVSAPTMGAALAGRTPGLSMVQTIGEPGRDDPAMYLRGTSTFNDVSPLIIIDGVPNTTREFMQLDPRSVENISVLKDASATAVYGVRGANGVIIVTTRRGRAGVTRVQASLSSGIQRPTNILDFANSYEWAKTYNLARDNDDASPDIERVPDEHVEWFRTGEHPLLFPSNDWTDVISGSAPQTRANFSITGGSENVQHYSSLSYFSQGGLIEPVIPEQQSYDYNRVNLSSNVDISISPTTQLDFTTGARIGTRTQPRSMWRQDQGLIWAGTYSGVPMWGAGMHDGKYIEPSQALYQQYLGGGQVNPIFHLYSGDHQIHEENRLHVHGSFVQELRALSPVLEGLNFRARFGYRAGYNRNTHKSGPRPPTYTSVFNKDAQYPNPDLDPYATVLIQEGTHGIENWSEWYSANRYLYMDAGLDYNRSFGIHTIGGLLLYNQDKNYYPGGQHSNIPSGTVGLVGRINYNYNRRYMLDVNVGYNGSENFHPDRRYGWFPSISGAWVVSSENFMQGITFLNELKLRASYGKVGSDQAGGGASRFTYVGSLFQRSDDWYHGYFFGHRVHSHQPGVMEAQIGNPDITWETAWKQNYGVDIDLFDRRISLNVDYFYEHRDDILMFRNSAPDWLAMDLPAVNIGEVENSGFEVQLGWRGQVGDLRFNLSGNVSHVRNRVLFMDELPPMEEYQTRTGHPMGITFGYVALGFYTQEEVDIINQQIADGVPVEQRVIPHPRGTVVKAGDMKYEDLNGDGYIDAVDRMPIGRPSRPELFGGINGGLSYRGFDLSFGFQGASMVSRNIYDRYRRFHSGNALFRPVLENSWTPETAETAEYPRITFDNRGWNSMGSTYWNRDASYIRLKRAEVGYSFSGPALPVERLRVYIRGNNLLTFKKEGMKHFDPEQAMAYPLLQLYMFGLDVTF